MKFILVEFLEILESSLIRVPGTPGHPKKGLKWYKFENQNDCICIYIRFNFLLNLDDDGKKCLNQGVIEGHLKVKISFFFSNKFIFLMGF